VADWGVGEDVFEQMPRNRFSRTVDVPARERRFAREDGEPRLRAVEGEVHEEQAGPPEEPRDVPRGRVDDGRRTIRIGKDEDVPSEIAAITADRDINAEEVATPVPERRTVKIDGRPEGSLEASRYQRDRDRDRRPRRTAHERVGHRPDRIAMWAFALGLLLILIAILTAL
jgi:hypothetical protein